MRVFLSTVAVLAAFSSVATAGPKEDALQVVEKWSKAFNASDVDGITNLYAPDALFLGTGSKTVVTKPEGVHEYFEQLRADMPRGATINNHEAMILSDTAVVITGLDTVTRVKDGKTLSARGRVTFLVLRPGDRPQELEERDQPNSANGTRREPESAGGERRPADLIGAVV
jgi:uncharacterized protein (TIGR02246 family)